LDTLFCSFGNSRIVIVVPFIVELVFAECSVMASAKTSKVVVDGIWSSALVNLETEKGRTEIID